MPNILPFSDEQLRTLANMQQRYSAWARAARDLHELPYDLRKKTVDGKTYLYKIFDRNGNGTSLGILNDARQKQFTRYRAAKQDAKNRMAEARKLLKESARLYKAVRLPMLSTDVGPVLREADKRRLLDGRLLVVGTHALVAYHVEAAGLIQSAPMETEDFDLAWTSEQTTTGQSDLWDTLKAVDRTFTVNTERPFQARNTNAFEIELLVAPSRQKSLGARESLKPIPLPEQEWLLLGHPVDHVVACYDGTAARIVAPDPRWFALHKMWLSDKPGRNSIKRPKDLKQGLLILSAVREAMPRYPMDEEFEAAIPGELISQFERWKAQAE